MSIEQAIQDNTAAITAQTVAITHLVVAFTKATISDKSGTTTPSEPVVETKKKAPEKKATAKVVEPEAELDEDVSEGEEVYPTLPKGVRDSAYYAKHVRPHLKALGDSNHAGLVKLLKTWGVDKGTEIESDNWDSLVGQAKAATPEDDDQY